MPEGCEDITNQDQRTLSEIGFVVRGESLGHQPIQMKRTLLLLAE